jgi:hypothetical protein
VVALVAIAPPESKSLFASFSSEKEDSFSYLKKAQVHPPAQRDIFNAQFQNFCSDDPSFRDINRSRKPLYNCLVQGNHIRIRCNSPLRRKARPIQYHRRRRISRHDYPIRVKLRRSIRPHIQLRDTHPQAIAWHASQNLLRHQRIRPPLRQLPRQQPGDLQ